VSTPLWRELIANAKGYEIERNYRMEIVELETALELFLFEFLKLKLEALSNDQIAQMILQHFRRMEDVTNPVFKAATGKTLKEMLEKSNLDKIYGTWKENVKDKRDRILHWGEGVRKEQAKKGFEAVFKIILFLKPDSIEYLYTSIERDKSLWVQIV
jgi:hypothetical protein